LVLNSLGQNSLGHFDQILTIETHGEPLDTIPIWRGMSTYHEYDREEQQVPVHGVTTEWIMRSEAFQRGVDDVRAGRPPCYDEFSFTQETPEEDCKEQVNAQWNYERGRQFALLAPATMPIRTENGKLNPRAVALFNAASDRGYIP
jgi:hypothetical protein